MYICTKTCQSCKTVFRARGGLTIWKPGHCLRARDAPGTFFIGFFESLGKDTGAP
ncbi:unnamed protein product [Staurois parvus]|uniref:Uncharacterized protein n=1 Tax=Staurois parvus TaxID=386267 RepID=A0ABN9FFH6_9NEOB|nr:unnamed protein product [Staurois parvus]